MSKITIEELSKSLKAYIDNQNVNIEGVAELINSLAAPINHNHNDVYYTETEIDSKLSEINNTMDDIISNLQIGIDKHNHDDIYYTEAEINSKLSEVNNAMNNLQSGIDSHTHNYAGSNSAGGSALSADSVNGLTLWIGTLTEYNALTSKSNNTLYFIKE